MKLKRLEDYEKDLVLEYRTKGSKNKQKIGPNTETVVQGEELADGSSIAAIGRSRQGNTQVVVKSRGEDAEPVETMKQDGEVVATVGQDVVKMKNYKDFLNKDAKDNPSNGAYDVATPKPEDKNYLKDMPEWPEDYEELFGKLVGKENFFVQGEAGWAKSAVIKKMALKLGYTVITVFMDKALPEDLGGIPIVKEDADGNVRQKTVMPVWAQYMYDNPNTFFLLFFDELNQAPNDVMNAMMPIAHSDHMICGHQFNNYICGAAGNLDSENELNQLKKPVLGRFGLQPIKWITGYNEDPEKAKQAWRNSFNFLHKKWDAKLDKKLIDAFKDACFTTSPPLFGAPRDLDYTVFHQLYEIKNSVIDNDDYDRITVRFFTKIITKATNTERGIQYNDDEQNKWKPEFDETVRKLAEKCYKFIAKEYKEETGRSFDDDEPETKKESKPTDVAETFDSSDKLDTMINLIASVGEITARSEKGKELKCPITPQTFDELFPKLPKEVMAVIEREMKKRNLKWKYPDDQAAMETGEYDVYYNTTE